tara:strand:+ start:6756 stop:7559 length:804 start_codon:yes stop_codon:yes gene_type:complete
MAIIDSEISTKLSTGEKIKIHRQNRNMSQTELSRLMKKTPVWLSKIERDQREIKVNDLVMLCNILKIDINQLLEVQTKTNSYKTILQNVVSSLPNEVAVYKMSEVERILRSNDLIEPTLYAYWDPNVLSSNNILGLFIEDDSNSPYINIGDRVYVNKNWHEGILLNNIANEEKIIKNFRDDTFWLIEKLPESTKRFSMLICKNCGGRQENFKQPSFDDEYSCLCSDGFNIVKSNFKDDKLSFSNNKFLLEVKKIRIVGRLVQIVKEI